MEAGWLERSLRDAREEAGRLPEWARQVISARDAYYGPRGCDTHRDPTADVREARLNEAPQIEQRASDPEHG